MERSRAIAWIGLVATMLAASSPCRAEPVDYLEDIKPLLRQRCYACHGPLKHRANLRLDTVAAMLEGGKRGAVVVPGNAARSLLIGATSGSAGFQMPPEGEGTRLTEPEIQLLRRWIEEGARFPSDERPAEDPRGHWSYQPVRRPASPALPPGGGEAGAWARNPIDVFIAR